MVRAYESGRCLCDRGRGLLELKMPDRLECVICGHEAPSLKAYHIHAVEHIPAPHPSLHISSDVAVQEGRTLSMEAGQSGSAPRKPEEKPDAFGKGKQVDAKKQRQARGKAMPVILKFALNLSLQIREATAQLWSTWVVASPHGSSLTKEYNSKYNFRMVTRKEEQAKFAPEESQGHEEGPPHLQAYEGLVKGLIMDIQELKDEEEVKDSQLNMQGIETLLETWADKVGEEAIRMIPQCRVSKTNRNKFFKVQQVSRDGSLLVLVRQDMLATEAEEEVGRAPASQMDRTTQRALHGERGD